ncbi:hypothetical protein F7Q99_36245 [Streptomyces kaniharaensis]|uniref:Uncharacterized protein n=1 Tax=Streptomyces kaniharaensis TaxID=212423 RepID=A0A6N7L578_9ACTN|nr:hypothetical protein [Streptomyces kaniharaensis]MQS17494.1 hypothetical protein [Streptomyces kaniharaensis]
MTDPEIAIGPDRKIAIDPPRCGCTECGNGEYVPLDEASGEQIARMLMGELRDHTERQFWVDVRWVSEPTYSSATRGSVRKVTVYSGTDPECEPGHTWDVTDHIPTGLSPLPWF